MCVCVCVCGASTCVSVRVCVCVCTWIPVCGASTCVSVCVYTQCRKEMESKFVYLDVLGVLGSGCTSAWNTNISVGLA